MNLHKRKTTEFKHKKMFLFDASCHQKQNDAGSECMVQSHPFFWKGGDNVLANCQDKLDKFKSAYTSRSNYIPRLFSKEQFVFDSAPLYSFSFPIDVPGKLHELFSTAGF